MLHFIKEMMIFLTVGNMLKKCQKNELILSYLKNVFNKVIKNKNPNKPISTKNKFKKAFILDLKFFFIPLFIVKHSIVHIMYDYM